jgi:hypothetical protein
MNPYLPSTALVLVAVMNRARDLEIARLLGWYRMPLRKTPKVIDVDYLAFYQTAAFGEAHRWRIECVAEVRGHELTTRKDLLRDEPDHPRANEEYYKVQLGPLIYLPEPILTGRWRRVTFLYTTGKQMQIARSLHDLAVNGDEERQVLWQALRERALQGGQYQASDLPEIAIDPSILMLFGGLGS